MVMCVLSLFFFSSRRRHTRLQGDWSSDVCSSDLSMGVIEPARGLYATIGMAADPVPRGPVALLSQSGAIASSLLSRALEQGIGLRSEERRVGKEGRSRWSPYH